MVFHRIRGRPLVRKAIAKASWPRAKNVLREVAPFLGIRESIIDIGAGSCVNAACFRANGYHVIPLDVRDASVVNGLAPLLCPGFSIPASERTYDTALLINMLHSASDPDALLAEAGRVASRVIVRELVPRGTLERYMSYAIDSVMDFEFPENIRDDGEWLETFAKHGFRLERQSEKTVLSFLRSKTYVLSSE